jgi:energy-coupling factor transporter ATP-binding protein EcfA2
MATRSGDTARERRALRVTRLRLRNWRNFREAKVTLDGRAFVVGPNASGKSNLLDALRFLRDVAKPTGGLASAFAAPHRRGFSAVRCLEARNPSYIELEIAVGGDAEPDLWGYTLRLQQRPRERLVTVEREEVRHRGVVLKQQLRPKTGGDPDLFSQTLLEQVQTRGEFRALVEFLTSIRYLHVVPQIVRDARRHLSEPDDPYGGDLLRRISDMPEKSRRPRLANVANALRVAVPRFQDLRLERDNDGRPHLLAAYNHWRPNAAAQPEEVFSDGALRLIGLLWSITEGGGPLLLEEPELSLHDAVVQQIPAMIQRARRLSGRQVIATTHSAAMLDVPTIAAAEVHRIDVSKGWSTIETVADDARAEAMIAEGGWTVGQAVLPLTAPERVEELARLDVALD